jgi:ABC-type branched-subunit amino acid transport system substrate-binding protein
MNHARSWIKLRNFLNKASFAFLCFALVLGLFSCSDSRPIRRNDFGSISSRSHSRQPEAAVIPPWQLWDTHDLTNPDLAAADALENTGQFAQSLRAYRELEQKEPPGRVKEEAFVRSVGTLLKLGKSHEALDQITAHLKAQGLATQDISPILALLAAYSYLHQNDFNQTLAWLGVAYRKTSGRGVVARRVTIETENVLRHISKDNFAAEYELWRADPFFAAYFDREKMRRAEGGLPDRSPAMLSWYRPQTYGSEVRVGDLRETDLNPAQDFTVGNLMGGTTVGVLLPLNGRYAAPAQRVREGIELALKDSGLADKVRLVFADTGGDPARAESEYERLATQEGAALVLGPLLVKCSEQVAQKSDSLGVPFITFTKRPGITLMSHVGFRLGATADNQATEVVSYAAQQLKLKSFALIYPDDGSGAEFAAAFRAAVSRAGGRLTGEGMYTSGNPGSVQAAVQKVNGSGAEAVFLPDTLEGASPVITALRTSALKDAVLLGPATWNDPVAVRGYGDLIEGAVYVTPFYGASSKPAVTNFVEHYRATYSREPDLLAAQGYDAADVALRSMQDLQGQQGDIKPALIKNLKSADSFDGVTGKLAVNSNGEITRRMSVLRLHRGTAIEVMSGGNVTGFVPDEPQQGTTAAKNG